VSGEVAVCRVTGCGGQYASRQCEIMYGLCWRNRHRSAPARSGFGRHVKSGSCDMPLRCAAGSAKEAVVGRGVGCVWVVGDELRPEGQATSTRQSWRWVGGQTELERAVLAAGGAKLAVSKLAGRRRVVPISDQTRAVEQ
jgi:hypothetical protein